MYLCEHSHPGHPESLNNMLLETPNHKIMLLQSLLFKINIMDFINFLFFTHTRAICGDVGALTPEGRGHTQPLHIDTHAYLTKPYKTAGIRGLHVSS